MLSWLKDNIKGVKGEEDCIFCKIRLDPTNQQLNKQKCFLYQDDLFFVIHDIKKSSAQQHILVLTKKHYRSAFNVPDETYFQKMKLIGIKVLKKLQQQNHHKEQQVNKSQKQKQKQTGQQKYRFGFHLPPYNSIDHIHLHGFLLPFNEWKYDKLLYGWMMTPIQEMVKKFIDGKK